MLMFYISITVISINISILLHDLYYGCIIIIVIHRTEKTTCCELVNSIFVCLQVCIARIWVYKFIFGL